MIIVSREGGGTRWAARPPRMAPPTPPPPPSAPEIEEAEEAAPKRRGLQAVMAFLLAMTVLFNPLLAYINYHLFTVSNSMVAVTQAGLVAGAIGIGVLNRERIPVHWMAFAAALLLANIALTLARQELNPRYYADVLTIPAFICLGMRMRIRWILGVVVGLQILLAIVGAWELQFPTAYTDTFNPRSYYTNTRGLTDRDFWAGGEFYVSAVRVQGRLLLDGFDFHRGSSLFLEPVSLGNWTILVTVVLIAFWGNLRPWQRVAMIVCNVVNVCVCDGRLALTTNLALPFILAALRFVPGWVSAFTPVLFGIGVVIIDYMGYLTEHGDTFAGRIRFSLDVLYRTTLDTLVGLEPIDPSWVDAGFSYLIGSQSLIVCAFLWLTLMISRTGEDHSSRMFKHGLAIFFVLCLSVSYSMLSVKIAGVLWALYGFTYARRHQDSPSRIVVAHREHHGLATAT